MKSNFRYQHDYPKHIIKLQFHKNAGRNIVCEWAACLPWNTGCNYTLWGSGQLLKASFFITGKLKWEQPLHPHGRAVGKTLQGHTDKMNLSKDQIVPMDHKTGCSAWAKVCRNWMQSAVDILAWRCEGNGQKKKNITGCDRWQGRGNALPKGH